ncbi:SGNH/GDSL hydrolase family protein [Histidinibacterium aquaticum]|uniref:SGNH/GDSL hydrolase family protein n=1 Tax=Histidinibacterium aquaticum TaxID=2613962 RepID=A0A5J5GL32_9RHOB|nr:SGNH/GDSL hydrolase family protein [Histidinibacterium aquaticum]KAA9008254.1 SGNH/GDSL hydrolase family protein [Histidinibacterium aquaticum]
MIRAVLFALLLASPAAAQERILAMGDSILSWHEGRGQSVPDAVALQLRTPVENRAVAGARISHPNALARLAGFDIRDQVPEDSYDWILANGGGNDLRDECGCTGCDATLDSLVTADGRSGEIPALVDRLLPRTDRLLWIGYYPVSIYGGPFAACAAELDQLATRLQAMAALRPRVHYLDTGRAMPPGALRYYAPDLTHPSPEGAARIGALAARTMREIARQP